MGGVGIVDKISP